MTEAPGDKSQLDDVMLAMDVVDTLRHRQLIVERELDAEHRERTLIERLRAIYVAQGMEVPDHVLAEGVAALREDRFSYEPPQPGLPVTLARLYVSRGRWGWPVLGALALAVLLWVAHAVFISGPEQRRMAALPDTLASERAAIVDVSKAEEVAARAEQLHADGLAALREGDADRAEEQVAQLQALRRQLDLVYDVQIVSRAGEPSGIWRIPDVNSNARNYYLIVEAVDSNGDTLSLMQTSEEDGSTREVLKWGLRVDESVYQRVAADKGDDGIIQNRRVGTKRRGHLTPEYLIPTPGALITQG